MSLSMRYFLTRLCAVLHEVVRPDIVEPFGAGSQARSIVQPQTVSFGLLGRDFQPFTSPRPIYALVVNQPARLLE